MKNKKQLGKALGAVSSGLYVLTAKHEKREDAVLASWVNQCSFDPPMISVMLATARPARVLVEASGSFIINVLGKDSETLMKYFFKAPKEGESIFKGLKTKRGLNGAEILTDALAYLECELEAQTQTGDHVLYVGKVVGGNILKGGEPYFHTRSNGFNY